MGGFGKTIVPTLLSSKRKNHIGIYAKNLAENNIITFLYADGNGYLWIGTMGKGLIQLNIQNGSQQVIAENPLQLNGHILSIIGNNNDVWVASLNGISQLIGKTTSLEKFKIVAWKIMGKKTVSVAITFTICLATLKNGFG